MSSAQDRTREDVLALIAAAFEEVAPDTYRNTRLSSAICTGKPVKEMLERCAFANNESEPVLSRAQACRQVGRYEWNRGDHCGQRR